MSIGLRSKGGKQIFSQRRSLVTAELEQPDETRNPPFYHSVMICAHEVSSPSTFRVGVRDNRVWTKGSTTVTKRYPRPFHRCELVRGVLEG